MDWACESQSAALRSQSRLSMSLVYGWTEGRGTSHWWVEVLGTTQPAVGSPQAEPTTSHWLPWHIRQHPWGKEFGEGREKKKSKQGVRGAVAHLCKQCHLTPHQAPLPSMPLLGLFSLAQVPREWNSAEGTQLSSSKHAPRPRTARALTDILLLSSEVPEHSWDPGISHRGSWPRMLGCWDSKLIPACFPGGTEDAKGD